MNNARQATFVSSLILGITFLALTSLPRAQEILRWDRHEIEAGQFYRLFSGHFVHLGLSHAVLNAVALMLITWIFRYALTLGEWLITIIWCCLFISLGLLWVTDITWYVGFSGVLHGLFLVSLLRDQLSLRWKVSILLLFCVKLLMGLFYGGDPLTEEFIGGSIVISAHWLGAVAGLSAYLYLDFFRRARTA